MITKDNNNDELSDLQIEKVNNLLDISIDVWEKWVKFIKNEQSGGIHFHTYHGTKGEEYRNVAIIMQHNFGSTHAGKNKFKNFFEFKSTNKNITELNDSTEESKITNTQNLIYVACTRAEINLWILYLDNIQSIENGIKSIFGDIDEWILE